ncbi:ABC transporter permease [Rhizobium halophytocola]|uniref:Phospholipid/cholesterol/gamma-HCH transport system permease protein n=1 Tax=Rhizobium halophytocola TaxID=735519 RepID=A0ABS4DZ74_9HYPH|nr:phospholipid/cholesterol/gamma-HCH transport system permease protein [Rhizobium halophytocola]
MKPLQQDKATIDVETSGQQGATKVRLGGPWINSSVSPVLSKLTELERDMGSGALEIDLSDVSRMDTTGAWLVRRLISASHAHNTDAVVNGAPQQIVELIEALPEELVPPPDAAPPAPIFQRVFGPIGRTVFELWDDIVAMLYVIGSAVRGAQIKFGRGSGVSPAAVVNQLDHMGVRAVPIVSLMSFLIGAIIAQQGAFQLRYFGAEVFVVDLVGILQLREIGVLLTAIMIAGRSGSAITAEIGSMKMREEIDALKVIGLNPIGVLVFPRLVALTIALPLLAVIANFAALMGAAVVTNIYSGITYQVFLSRLHEAIDYSTIASGMIKAPFMALAVGVVAAVEGMKVGGSAESLGQHVTASVVKSIFIVILIDAVFAIFYSAIDF